MSTVAWEWETGELEKTLRGHARHVTDCQYESKGKYLGGLWFSYVCRLSLVLMALSVVAVRPLRVALGSLPRTRAFSLVCSVYAW